MHNDGLISSLVWKIKPEMDKRATVLVYAVHQTLRGDLVLEAEELDTDECKALRARSALLGLRHERVIIDEVFEKLGVEVDALLTEQSPRSRVV